MSTPAPHMRRPMLALLVFFVLAHGWSLVSHSIAWDGFAYYELLRAHDFATVATNHLNDGFPQDVVTYGFAYLWPDIILGGKVLSFLSNLVAMLAFYYALRRTRVFNATLSWVAAALFGLHSNVAVSLGLGTFHYEFCTALFGLALVLYLRAEDARRRWARLALLGASAALFFVAFYIPSLLVFYGVAVILMYYVRFGHVRPTRADVIAFVRERWFFLVLPLLAFLLRPTQHGNYASENHIALSRYWVTGYVDVLALNVWPTVEAPFRFLAAQPGLLVVLALFWLLGWSLLRKTWDEEVTGSFRGAFWLAVIMYMAAVFPFAAVGKIPSYKDWGSRFAHLVPAGQSLFLAAVAWFATRRWNRAARQAVLALLLALFATSAFENWRRWDADWMKQAAAIDQLKRLPQVREAHTIWFLDDTPELNNLERYYRFYEYNAWMLEAYGDGEKRLGVAAHSYPAKVTDPMARKTFLVHDYFPPETPRAIVTISRGTMDPLQLPDYCRLKWRELFGRDPHWADPVVTLQAERLPDSAPPPSRAP